MITASKIELAMRCPGSVTLPQSWEPNAYADAGTERHADDEEAIGRGEIPEILTDTWPDYTWRAEVMFVFNIATGEGREIGQGSDRAYGDLDPFDVAGTADVVGRKGDRLVIVDKKSFENVTRAAENPQVRFLALAAARAYGLDEAEVAINHLLRKIDRADLDALDLDIVHHEVRQTVISVAKAQNDARNGIAVPLHTGRWCRWCAAFHNCPLQRDLALEVRTDAASLRVEATIPFGNDDDAADAFELLTRIKLLSTRLSAALYARAGERPIPLHSGMMLGKIERLSNEKLDGDIVYEVVKEQHGQGIADAAVVRSATKKQLKDALGLAGGKVAALERKVLDAVRDRGGSKRETKIVIEEYAPPRELAEGP